MRPCVATRCRAFLGAFLASIHRALARSCLVEGDFEFSSAVVDVEVVAAVEASGDVEVYGRVADCELFEADVGKPGGEGRTES